MNARTLAAVALMLACEAGHAQNGGIERAAWLQGCWELTTPTRTVEEMWTTPKGGSMIGVSRTIRDGKLTEYELIVLREQGDRLAYQAHPSGQPAATFLSTRISASELDLREPRPRLPAGDRLSPRRRCAARMDTRHAEGTGPAAGIPVKRARCAGQ